MAVVKNNLITQGLSGTLGHSIVFRQVAGRTIVSTPPNFEGEATLKQKAHRQRFKMAAVYAQAQMNDPLAKAEYQIAIDEQHTSVYTLAMTDFLKAPEIESIDVSMYAGKVGDILVIRAIDNFKVKMVTVSISNADGSLVEKGNAVQQPNQLDWLYTATKANTALVSDKVLVTAMDKPGNVTTKERIL